MYKVDFKHGNRIEYCLDTGDVLIEQCKDDEVSYMFSSWGCEAYLDDSTVAVFRITKLK